MKLQNPQLFIRYNNKKKNKNISAAQNFVRGDYSQRVNYTHTQIPTAHTSNYAKQNLQPTEPDTTQGLPCGGGSKQTGLENVAALLFWEKKCLRSDLNDFVSRFGLAVRR